MEWNSRVHLVYNTGRKLGRKTVMRFELASCSLSILYVNKMYIYAQKKLYEGKIGILYIILRMKIYLYKILF